MRKRVISITIIALAILLVIALPSAAYAKKIINDPKGPYDSVDLRAPYDSVVTLTYLGNPYDTGAEILDLEPPAELTVGAPYNLDLGTVGSIGPRGGNMADLNATYIIGPFRQGQELYINVSLVDADIGGMVYSTNSTLSDAQPVITATQVSNDVTNYTVYWHGFIYYSTQGGKRYDTYGQLYDYPLNVTFTRADISCDPLANLAATRDFYTNVYPHLWTGSDFKIPYVAVNNDQNKVVKVLIKSNWDPATIGMTKEQVNDCIQALYGVQPTYV